MGETNNKQDPLQRKGGPASGSEKETPGPVAKTYTEEEHNKAVEKAKSDVLATAGRTAKDFEERETGLSLREATIADREAEQERIQLEDAKKDPAKMVSYQAQQAEKKAREKLSEDKAKLKQEREQLERDKTESAALIEAAQASKFEQNIWEIAATYEIDPTKLKADVAKLELKTEEQIKTYAQRLSGKEPELETKKETKKVDPGVTSGSRYSSEGKTSRQIFADKFREDEKKKK